jgi:hypothetical protein
MSQTKLFAIALGIACIILAASLGGTIEYYQTTTNNKDLEINTLKEANSNNTNKISQQNETINQLDAIIANLKNQHDPGPDTSRPHFLPDKTVFLETFDPIDLCYDAGRNVIWIANHVVPGLTKLNATTMTEIANISFPMSLQPYRIAYDGKYLWISTALEYGTPTYGGPAAIIRVDPDTLAWSNWTFPNDIGHQFGCALAIAYSPSTGKEYVFVGLGSNSTKYAAYLERFDAATFPSAPTEINLRYGNYYNTQCREIVYTGDDPLFVSGDGGRVMTVTIENMTIGYATRFGASVFSGCWDGEYLWWGLNNGTIVKMNPTTYAFASLPIDQPPPGTTRLMHRFVYSEDGFIWVICYTDGKVWTINCASMTATLFPPTFNSPHGICFDGANIWICDNCTENYANPGRARLSRYVLREPIGGGFIMP